MKRILALFIVGAGITAQAETIYLAHCEVLWGSIYRAVVKQDTASGEISGSLAYHDYVDGYDYPLTEVTSMSLSKEENGAMTYSGTSDKGRLQLTVSADGSKAEIFFIEDGRDKIATLPTMECK